MSIDHILYEYLANYKFAEDLFRNLLECGEVYLIGGVLREFLDHRSFQKLRDIDVVVDIKCKKSWARTMEKFNAKRNSFGGNKIYCEDLIIDAWDINQTWAFREKKIVCPQSQCISRLGDTVFLNIDGIVYDWAREVWYDAKYQEAMLSRTLDVVLESNPQIPLNIVRAFVLQDRYNMVLSPKLKGIIDAEYKSYVNMDSFVDILMDVQLNRYHKCLFTKNDLVEKIVATIES